jgi:hypothetical protein
MMMIFNSLKMWYAQQTVGIFARMSTGLVHAQETLTADAVQRFLRESQFPLLIENGGLSVPFPRNAGGANSQFRQPHSWPTNAVMRILFPMKIRRFFLPKRNRGCDTFSCD